jgi:hypothetical protein
MRMGAETRSRQIIGMDTHATDDMGIAPHLIEDWLNEGSRPSVVRYAPNGLPVQNSGPDSEQAPPIDPFPTEAALEDQPVGPEVAQRAERALGTIALVPTLDTQPRPPLLLPPTEA